MQLLIKDSSQVTATGNSGDYVEPNFNIARLVIDVSQISVNLLGSITIKAQCSPDGENWFDIPNLSTGGLTATGAVTVNLSSLFRAGDHLRIVWTFSNANSITFKAYLVGEK